MWSKSNSDSILVEMPNNWEIFWQFCTKLNSLIIQPKLNGKWMSTQKLGWAFFNHRLIRDLRKLEATTVSFTGWLHVQTVLYLYNRILFNKKHELSSHKKICVTVQCILLAEDKQTEKSLYGWSSYLASSQKAHGDATKFSVCHETWGRKAEVNR